MKKICAILLALVVMCSLMTVAALADGSANVVVTADKTSVKVGEEVTINISITNASQVGCVGFEVSHPGFEQVSATVNCKGSFMLADYSNQTFGAVGSAAVGVDTLDVVSITLKATDAAATTNTISLNAVDVATVDYVSLLGSVGSVTIALAHDCDFVENVDEHCLVSAANCSSAAVYYKSCSVCGEHSTETFTVGDKDMTNHVGGTDTEVGKKAASCTEEGYTGDTVCASCETVLTKGETIEKLAHTGGEATCVKGAVCDVCGKEYGEKDPANHADLVTEGKKDPTCTEAGSTGTGKCNACGVELDAAEEIPALGHKGGEATCMSGAVCETCGETYTEKDPANHVELTYVEGVEATCMEEGVVAHYECVCGACFLDEAATQICEDHVIPVNPDAHSFTGGMMAENGEHWEVCDHGCTAEQNRAACTFDNSVYAYDEAQHWIVCDVCGMTEGSEHEDHVFGEWYVDQAATATETGVKLRECETCGYVEDATIPATGATSPKTGDESNIVLWAVMFLAAGTGALVLSRKKEY